MKQNAYCANCDGYNTVRPRTNLKWIAIIFAIFGAFFFFLPPVSLIAFGAAAMFGAIALGVGPKWRCKNCGYVFKA